MTIFRVLSISFVIVVLPFIWIPIYSFFAVVIICVGYIKTKRGKTFIMRGLKSAFTSGFIALRNKLHKLMDALIDAVESYIETNF